MNKAVLCIQKYILQSKCIATRLREMEIADSGEQRRMTNFPIVHTYTVSTVLKLMCSQSRMQVLDQEN